jgi:hypothetical protein
MTAMRRTVRIVALRLFKPAPDVWCADVYHAIRVPLWRTPWP